MKYKNNKNTLLIQPTKREREKENEKADTYSGPYRPRCVFPGPY
jgi:hypothetical protein